MLIAGLVYLFLNGDLVGRGAYSWGSLSHIGTAPIYARSSSRLLLSNLEIQQIRQEIETKFPSEVRIKRFSYGPGVVVQNRMAYNELIWSVLKGKPIRIHAIMRSESEPSWCASGYICKEADVLLDRVDRDGEYYSITLRRWSGARWRVIRIGIAYS